MNIQWYPGHMTKTRRLIEENVKNVDLVIEVVDARIPQASRNPMLGEILGGKKQIILLNKSDIADPETNRAWVEYYRKLGIPAVLTNAKAAFDTAAFFRLVKDQLAEKLQALAEKGVKKPIRMMVVGIPNSGKSSLINRLTGRASLKAEDRPGVTKQKQWVALSSEFELMDTPGILWPKFDDEEVSLKLAFTGAIRDEIMDTEELAYFLLDRLKGPYSALLEARYKVPVSPEDDTMELFERIAKARGCRKAGGVTDTERVSRILLDEFRGAVIGCISLEAPESMGL